ncbi:glycosyltransferase domain-containing protein [Litoribacter populi]|uniref:glycosyltransferase domain-containing protein n=1 Tax=Litoribacter populi TaxID=2598460 RepID=UPI00117D7C92|nr:glycosyltransferase domain-containing protein [Litoribacter populi]
MDKFVVYTCITDNYDWLLPPLVLSDNVDYICFSDSYKGFHNNWEVRPIPKSISNLPGNLINRYLKIFPHKFMDQYKWSIYVDGNIRILNDLRELVSSLQKNNYLMGCPLHPERKNIHEEIVACKKLNKFSEKDLLCIENQYKDYILTGMPLNFPLTENNILIRCHGNIQIQNLMQLWWEHLEKYSKRDQISLPYLIWLSGLSIKRFPFAASIDNKYFKKISHRKKQPLFYDLKDYVFHRQIDGFFWKVIFFKFRVINFLYKNLYFTKGT